MRSRRTWFHLLLAVGFALGQWCAIVHASQHEILPHVEKTPCPICAIAHAAAAKPAALALPPARWVQERVAERLPASHPRVRGAVRPPSRAPPLFPV